MRDDFAVFILTHGRPDRQHTLATLEASGYSGRVFLVVDNEDATLGEYRDRYGDRLLVFSKDDVEFDTFDGGRDRRSIVWARNVCWRLARDVGVRYFVQFDDDYTSLLYRRPGRKDGAEVGYHGWTIRSMDAVLEAMVAFLAETPAHAVCMSQGGDHLGGWGNRHAARPTLRRKAMNSFVLDVERPFEFPGRINEDVNAYVGHGARGLLFFTYSRLQLNQVATQTNEGGMTGLYRDGGTYIKSMFTVVANPSSVRVRTMGRTARRLHHHVSWRHAVPKIVRESLRKVDGYE